MQCNKGYILKGPIARTCDKIPGTNQVRWTENATVCEGREWLFVSLFVLFCFAFLISGSFIDSINIFPGPIAMSSNPLFFINKSLFLAQLIANLFKICRKIVKTL